MYKIKNVTILDNFSLLIIINMLDNEKDVKIILLNMRDLIDNKVNNGLFGKELAQKEVFEDIEVDSYVIEWNRTDGYSLGLDTIYSMSELIFETNPENKFDQ